MEMSPSRSSDSDETCSEGSESEPVQESSGQDSDEVQSSEKLWRVTGLYRVKYARIKRAASVSDRTKNYNIKVRINEKAVRLLVDTGSPITIQSHRVNSQLFGDQQVYNASDRKFADYNGNEIPMKGSVLESHSSYL